MKDKEVYEQELDTPLLNIRAKRALYRERQRLARDMAELEKQIEEANDEVQEITKDALAKQEEIKEKIRMMLKKHRIQHTTLETEVFSN
jgi:ElaB/YqjD/DUF883 family membrane-anchored ribosome-binding protein